MNNPTLFFPHEEDDDLFDLYEERLFEDKQFFKTKPIIPLLFEKRFEKMRKRELAFRSLTNSVILESAIAEYKSVHFNSIPDAYRFFETYKAKTFVNIFSAKSVSELIVHVENLLGAQADYWVPFHIPHDSTEGAILLSAVPEPGLFANAINNFEKAGGKTVEDLQQLTFEGKETLLQEAKRLSLLRKKKKENEEL